jgi:hypothetical protein
MIFRELARIGLRTCTPPTQQQHLGAVFKDLIGIGEQERTSRPDVHSLRTHASTIACSERRNVAVTSQQAEHR